MVTAIGGVVRVGRARSPVYTFIVHALADKAKPWFRFTRYLPSISLMGRLWPAQGAICGAAGDGA
jgi:hypothetical protein